MLGKISALLAAVASFGLLSLGPAHAAGHHHHAAAKHRRLHGLSSPALLTPAVGARGGQVPVLTWSGVGGAAEYEYQVSADQRFDSIVLGSGSGQGSSTTHNLAATLAKTVTDGTYYWRVRGLTSSREPGPWSATGSFVKAWADAPRLLGPSDGAAITWPSVPLVLSWTAVPGATEYVVTIATDPALSNIVVGSATSPTKTDATVAALSGTLASGRYYWAITPIDAEGHRGTRSRVGVFNWSWPTSTTTQLSDLATPFGFEPQFSWTPVPGAARYEVEVNQSPEFPPGSKWCCNSTTIGTSLAPTEVLANDHSFYWRVRAIDASGNAGQWNLGVGEHGNPGEGFTEAFDNTAPSISNLRMSDSHGNALPPDPTTDTPIITWSPVAGASSYEVQITRYVAESGCNWAAAGGEKQVATTSSLAWTPLGPNSTHIGPAAWPSPDTKAQLKEGNTPYCVRVLARAANDAKGGQVVSSWTQIGGSGQPAFTFASQPPPGSPGPEGLQTSAGSYLLPTPGSTSPRTPLFTWARVPGASLYYVVIARDQGFTNVVDVASTVVPAYAPQLGGEQPLNDQTNAYYWAVVPVNAKGEVFSEPPLEDAPQSFSKFSIPPTPLAPTHGAEAANQPTFSWTPAEGALNYTLQVSEDPTFGNPIDNVRTDSTAYTSSSTYPADVTLYWRVRANDTNYHAEGLNWSQVQTFRRTLPVPTPSAATPTSSESIPVHAWTPVTGATAYDVHVEEPNGNAKDFTVDSTAYTATEWAGPGIWRWQARAEFPTGSFSTVAGGYFSPRSIVHLFAAPTGAAGVKSGSRLVISWNPDPYAKEYEAQVSTTDTFSSTIDSQRLDGTSWAPNIDLTQRANQGTLFWRVAARDTRSNLSPFASGSFAPPRPAAHCKLVRVTTKKAGKSHTVIRCATSKRTTSKHHKKHH